MKSIYPELALCGSQKECARTDTVFLYLSQVSEGTVCLLKLTDKLIKETVLFETKREYMLGSWSITNPGKFYTFCASTVGTAGSWGVPPTPEQGWLDLGGPVTGGSCTSQWRL